MTQDLFTAQYPVKGREPIAATFGASRWAYFSWSIPSICLLILVLMLRKDPTMNSTVAAYILDAALVWVLLVVVVCRSIEFEITQDSIAYKSLWRNRREIRFSDISSAVMIEYHFVSPGKDYSGNRSPRMWTLVLTPKVTTGERPLRIPLTWIEWGAHAEIVRILDPAEWAPD